MNSSKNNDSVSYRMMQDLEPLPDAVRSKFRSMEKAPSVIGSLTSEQKKRVFSSDAGETNGPANRLCVFCLKVEGDKTPWCASNPGLGCTYGMGHEYRDEPAPKDPIKQPKRPSALCKKCGLHPKNPASKTNGCEHSFLSEEQPQPLITRSKDWWVSKSKSEGTSEVSAGRLDNLSEPRYYVERDDEDIISLLFADKTRKILRGGPYGENKAWVIEYEFTHNGSVEKYQLPLDKHKVLLHRLSVRGS